MRRSTKPCAVGREGAAGVVHDDERDGYGLARLHERERLEHPVHRSEAAGEEGDRVRFLEEHELAREEVAERDELLVPGDDGVGVAARTGAGC